LRNRDTRELSRALLFGTNVPSLFSGRSARVPSQDVMYPLIQNFPLQSLIVRRSDSFLRSDRAVVTEVLTHHCTRTAAVVNVSMRSPSIATSPSNFEPSKSLIYCRVMASRRLVQDFQALTLIRSASRCKRWVLNFIFTFQGCHLAARGPRFANLPPCT
jgi:hypothetical protein